MNVNVVPFPLSRRRAFVWRHATIINGMSPENADRRLANQLKVQSLKRRGITEDRINGELASLKRAILSASEPAAHEQ